METLLHNLNYLKGTGLKSPLLERLLQSENPEAADLIAFTKEQSLSLDQLISKAFPLSTYKAKMLVMDCDGVLTKGEMIVSTDGEHTKIFNVKDGMGIKKAQAAGILTGIISHGHSTGVVEARAQQLSIPKVYVGKEDKLSILQTWATEENIELKDIAYIGDDINDLPVLEAVGIGFCPADAVKEVLQSPKVIVLSRKGGEACIRELVEEHLNLD